jgi:hypothetical protein
MAIEFHSSETELHVLCGVVPSIPCDAHQDTNYTVLEQKCQQLQPLLWVADLVMNGPHKLRQPVEGGGITPTADMGGATTRRLSFEPAYSPFLRPSAVSSVKCAADARTSTIGD